MVVGPIGGVHRSGGGADHGVGVAEVDGGSAGQGAEPQASGALGGFSEVHVGRDAARAGDQGLDGRGGDGAAGVGDDRDALPADAPADPPDGRGDAGRAGRGRR